MNKNFNPVPYITFMRSNKGNKVPNQLIIHKEDGIWFRSYDTNIAFIANGGKVYLDRDKWDYSTTTGKYRNQFLGETIKETRKKIASGEYVLAELN